MYTVVYIIQRRRAEAVKQLWFMTHAEHVLKLECVCVLVCVYYIGNFDTLITVEHV